MAFHFHKFDIAIELWFKRRQSRQDISFPGRAWERGIKAGLLLCKSQREKINLLVFTWQPFWCCGLPNCYAIIAQRVARICVSEPSGDNRYRVPIEMTASSERIQKW
jgi:hypothetical protein